MPRAFFLHRMEDATEAFLQKFLGAKNHHFWARKKAANAMRFTSILMADATDVRFGTCWDFGTLGFAISAVGVSHAHEESTVFFEVP